MRGRARCTLTATSFPVARSTARCTCARLATPIGAGSNSENSSSIDAPMSARNMASTSADGVGSHRSCSGRIVLVHSTGSTISDEMCWPSLMKMPATST
jgi:hypothetical protein